MAKTLSDRLEQVREIRDSLLDILQGRAKQSHNSYSIGDRSIAKMTMEEIRNEYAVLDREVDRLERKHRRATGKSSHIRFKF